MNDGPRLLTFAQLDARTPAFDTLLERTPEVDLFCSSTDWILPARFAFARSARPFILEHETGYVALMSVPTVEGIRALFPLEASWGLASPFIGPDPEPLVEALFRVVDQKEPPADALSLSGVQGRARRAIEREVASRGRWTMYEGPVAGRHVALIEGGVDAFLARRSSKFRANLRRERRVAAREGVTYEGWTRFGGVSEVLAIYDRIQRVEQRCWKGHAGHGIDLEPGYTFYRQMVLRLAARHRLRVVFARRDGEDIAYVFGGVFAGTYRGLQCSYDHRFRHLAPGVLVHTEMIERLTREGIAIYDLGSEMEYKRRWGEEGLQTVTCVVVRSH